MAPVPVLDHGWALGGNALLPFLPSESKRAQLSTLAFSTSDTCARDVAVL